MEKTASKQRVEKTVDAPNSKLERFRSILISMQLDGFIVPTDDPHLSEYVAPYFNRREYISGFTGSAGVALITLSNALLWTDGRYFLQAEIELENGWTLMKSNVPGTPTMADYISKSMTENSTIGIDPYLHSVKFFKDLSNKIKMFKINVALLPEGTENPVDSVWGNERPSFPAGHIRVHNIEYAGDDFETKTKKIREKISERKAYALVLNALDEIAYVFNIRGSDVDYNPVVVSYAVICEDSCHLFINLKSIPEAVLHHLKGVVIHPYDQISPFLKSLEKRGNILVDETKVNLAIWNAISDTVRVSDVCPVTLMKAIKNDTELNCMRQCHLRDSAALSEFLCWIDKEIKNGSKISEVQSDQYLTEYRKKRDKYLYPSFATIAGSGPNGAIIHYKPKEATCRNLDVNSLFLLDSGAQYEDGTTDVTRTVHFGVPTAEEIASFTLVLKGYICLESKQFPEGTAGYSLDAFARSALWDAGLDYAHGTGHGVGAALNVHEGPHSISTRPGNATPLQPGMITSIEPGYYLPGKFGIRIENLVEIIDTGKRNEQLGRSFYCFSPLTLVPIQKSLVDVKQLSAEELTWLNTYHELVWEKISPLVDEETVKWLRKATSRLM